MIYIDDSIMQKGEIASAGSRYLKNFIAPLTATAVTRLGGEVERIQLSEFGIDFFAGSLKAPMLANAVLGHIRIRAAEQGFYYLRPTYGTVSRYGLIPTASSMDQIGVICENLDQGFDILSHIAGKDEKDGAMFPETHYDYTKKEGSLRFAVPEGVDLSEVQEYAEKLGAVRIQLPHMNVYEQVLLILAYAEISNNISRYDGVKYGYRAPSYSNLGELYTRSRAELGFPAQVAAIVGTALLSEGYYDKYYIQAMKLRRMIKESLRFDEYDVLMLPAGSPVPVLAGLPSVTFGGIELAADVCCEGTLRTAWEVLHA